MKNQLELWAEPALIVPLFQAEEWRAIPEFPGYECSSNGRFRNSAGVLFHGHLAHNGYVHIGPSRNGRQITCLAHRLIASAFLTPPSPDHVVVNHVNKVRNDNRVVNLEWATRSQNSLHAWAT
jgi:hypothetical protein